MTAGLLRPQPLGILPLPAGALLLPDVDGADRAAAELGRALTPSSWPAGLAFYAAAAAGDIEGARASLAGQADPLSRYNGFVLAPTPAGLAALRQELAAEPVLLVLAEVAAFSAGLTDSAPPVGDGLDPELVGDDALDGEPLAGDPLDGDLLDGELLAFALLARAAEALEHRTPAEAVALLTDAVEAAAAVPALAASLLGSLAELEPDSAVQRYGAALALLPTGHQTQVRAELLYGRAVALQAAAGGRAGMLKEAVRCYQQALVVFRRETHPELFAEAQTNLALCHLATPMVEAGDRLRLSIAVQALRDALTVWDRESHPQQWASVTLNLANALQYLPSTHQEDNLAEVVEHYEQLLTFRDAAADPLGYARVLANQGNALAHLGIVDHARDKLLSAQQRFAAAGDTASAEAVTGTLVELEAMTLVAGQHA